MIVAQTKTQCMGENNTATAEQNNPHDYTGGKKFDITNQANPERNQQMIQSTPNPRNP